MRSLSCSLALFLAICLGSASDPAKCTAKPPPTTVPPPTTTTVPTSTTTMIPTSTTTTASTTTGTVAGTTSTTIPEPGFVCARCSVNVAIQTPACANQGVPARVALRLERADTLVERAAGSSAKRSHALLKLASGRLKKAAQATMKAAGGRHPKLSTACASAVRDAIESARQALGL